MYVKFANKAIVLNTDGAVTKINQIYTQNGRNSAFSVLTKGPSSSSNQATKANGGDHVLRQPRQNGPSRTS